MDFMHNQSDKYTIFYLDDDFDDQYLFRETLENIQSSHELYTQSEGEELLQLLESPPPSPSMIFLDLNMPGMTGFEVLEKIKTSAKSEKIPVIIFSTSSDESTKVRCRELGANMFITKPQDYRQLTSVLDRVLKINWRNPSSYKFQISN